jgi:hypothetical protein
MRVKRVAWWTWIVLTIIWTGLLFLTGKYWCPLLFWHSGCTVGDSFQQLISLSGVPLMMLGAGTAIGWIVGAVRAKISKLKHYPILPRHIRLTEGLVGLYKSRGIEHAKSAQQDPRLLLVRRQDHRASPGADRGAAYPHLRRIRWLLPEYIARLGGDTVSLEAFEAPGSDASGLTHEPPRTPRQRCCSAMDFCSCSGSALE